MFICEKCGKEIESGLMAYSDHQDKCVAINPEEKFSPIKKIIAETSRLRQGNKTFQSVWEQMSVEEKMKMVTFVVDGLLSENDFKQEMINKYGGV